MSASEQPQAKQDRDPTTLVDWELRFNDNKHAEGRNVEVEVEKLNFWYGDKHALQDVSLNVFAKEVTALIGPSGCGKSTLIRCFNRMNDLIRDTRIDGRIRLQGQDIYEAYQDPADLRARFGWIAQKPNPFPNSVYDNVAYGIRLRGLVETHDEMDVLVEDALRKADLWSEIRDRMHEAGTDLSGGQQQRLCIARAIASRPDVILMDEPCSALDPTATQHIEDLIGELRKQYTIVIVTHNMQQAARISQRAAFMHLGKLLEDGDTEQVFLNPQTDLCKNYITGRYG